MLFNRFKDYKIAAVTLGDMSVEDAAPIFERINSMGTPLTIVDLMRAATWSPDFDLIHSIEGTLGSLEEKGFRAIDRKTVLRNLAAAVGGGFSTDSIDALRNRDADALGAAMDEVREAYKRMVDFLTADLRVPGGDVVPYSNQLTVLAEVFRRVPTPSAEQFDSIRVWFWRTSVAGYFSGWNTGMMRSDLEAVEAFAKGESAEIVVGATEPNASIWTTRQFRSNNAHAKLLAIVLSYHQPVDLLTGSQIDTAKALAWVNSKEFHHFFPQAYLKREKVARLRINALANIVMLSSSSNKEIRDSPPSEYLAHVEKAAGDNLEAWLGSNLISMEAFEAAKRDDFEAFLSSRAQAIHNAVLQLAGWGEISEGPSVESESVADEIPVDEADGIEYVVEEPSTDLTQSVGVADDPKQP